MNKRFFVTLTVAFAFCGFSSIYAQEKVITGTVKVGAEGAEGVEVVVPGSDNWTTTDSTGKYTLTANVGDVVEYHYVGYRSENRTVGAANVINITLIEDETQLDEIVVLAYGQQRNKNEITGNVVRVSGEEISKAPMVSADQALQGRVAGLSLAGNSGTPGSTQQIRIRGMNSINASNDPLIVVDGVPVSNNNLSGDSASSSSLSALSSINSNDIESITVLKDAGATSVYGARGANGVILITTKRGKSGGTRYEFVSSLGVQNNAIKGPRSLSGQEKLDLLLEAYNNTYNGGGPFDSNGIYNQLIERFPGETEALQEWVNKGKPVNDWNKMMLNKDALISILGLSATGGDEKSNFYASLGYNKTEGTVIGSDFRRVSGVFNYERQLSDKIDFGFNANVSNIKQEGILEQGAFFSNPNLIRYFMSPWNSAYNDDGSLNLDRSKLSGLHNPLYTIPNNIRFNDVIRVLNNNRISYKFTDNLKFTSQLSTDYTYIHYRNYNNPVHGDGFALNGYAENSSTQTFKYNAQNGLDYRFYLGDDHKFDAKVLMEYEKLKANYLYGYGESIPEGFDMLGNASANYNASSNFFDEANLSYLGLLNYNYANKYMIDASLRREGNSKFHPDNRWGTFWSVGAAWNVMNEEFLIDNEVLSTFRLRGSYGTAGNSGITRNSFQNTLSTDRYNGNIGFLPSQLGDNITWEVLTKTDLGVNLGFFNDRFTASFAYFRSLTNDLLLNVPVTRTSGYTSVVMNTGELENKGFEFDLSAQLVKTDNFSWTVYGNLGTVKNKILSMPTDASGEKMTITSSTTRIEEGYEMRGWYMRKYAGVDSQTGEAMWYVNGVDGETTKDYNEADVAWQGKSAMPTYSGGFGTQIEVGSFFAGVNFAFAGGNKVYEDWGNYVQGVTNTALLSYNSTDYILDRWQNPGDETQTPKLSFSSNDVHRASTRFLKDGDYIRLRDVTFGYNFKANALQHMKLDGLTLSVRGTNLHTWIKDKTLKFDPEVGMNAGDGSYGYTGFISPPVKSVIFTVNVKF